EGRGVELETGQHLSAVARARTPSGALSLEHDHRRAGASEMARRRKAGITGPDDRDIRLCGVTRGAVTVAVARSALRRGEWKRPPGNGIPPVREILHLGTVGSGTAADARIARPRCSCTNATIFSRSRFQSAASGISARADT